MSTNNKKSDAAAMSDFRNAIDGDDIAEVNRQFENNKHKSGDVTEWHKVYESSLHEAITKNRPEMVKLLLSRGVNPNGITRNATTPLHRAVDAGNLDMIKILLEGGASPSLPNKDGLSPAHHILDRYRAGLVRIIENPLGLDAIELLVQHGFPIDTRNDSDETILLFAVKNAFPPDFIAGLLHLGADVALKGRQETQAIHLAAKAGQPTMDRHATVLTLLVEHGANINAPGWHGYTPLHLGQWLETAAKIIALGGDVHARNDTGETPLLSFMKKTGITFIELAKIINLFLDAGADPDVCDLYGDTPKSIAEREDFDKGLAIFAAYDAKKAMMTTQKKHNKF